MIRLLPDGSINLGPRPTGFWDVVQPSGEGIRHTSDPGGVEIELSLTPLVVQFPNRPRTFITANREARKQLLTAHKKPKSKKPPTQETTNERRNSTGSKRPRKLSTTTTSLLSGLDPELRALFEAQLK